LFARAGSGAIPTLPLLGVAGRPSPEADCETFLAIFYVLMACIAPVALMVRAMRGT
jgi:hypothetical protein